MPIEGDLRSVGWPGQETRPERWNGARWWETQAPERPATLNEYV